MATYLREDEVFGSKRPIRYLSDAEIFGAPETTPKELPAAKAAPAAVTQVEPPAEPVPIISPEQPQIVTAEERQPVVEPIAVPAAPVAARPPARPRPARPREAGAGQGFITPPLIGQPQPQYPTTARPRPEPIEAKEPPEMRPYEPSLWQRFLDLLPGDRAKAANEALARRIAREQNIPVDEAYRRMREAVGVRGVVGTRPSGQPMWNPEGRAPIRATTEAAPYVAEGILDIPKGMLESALRTYRAGDIENSVDAGFVDRAITKLGDESKDIFIPNLPERLGLRRDDPNYRGFMGLGKSLGYSLTTMVASATTGVAATMTTGNPLVGVGAGMAASGTVAYRASKDDFLNRLRDKLNTDSKKVFGQPISQDAWNAAKKEFNSAAVEYGAWEAIPEAISNAIFLKAFAKPVKGADGSRLAGYLQKALSFGAENLTETATGMGQNAAELKAGLTKDEITVADAFKQQFIQTAITMGVMSGGIKGKQLATQFYNEQVLTKIDPASALAKAIKADIDATAFNPQAIKQEAAAVAAGARPRTLQELARQRQVAPVPPSDEEPPEAPITRGEPGAIDLTLPEEATGAREPIFEETALPPGRAEPSLGEGAPSVEGRVEPGLGEGVVTPGRAEPTFTFEPLEEVSGRVEPSLEGPPPAPPAAPPTPEAVALIPGTPSEADLAEQPRVTPVAPVSLEPVELAEVPTGADLTPAEEVRQLNLQKQKDAGWNTDWPFVPVDLTNPDFRELIAKDPDISAEEKKQIFDAGRKLGVVPPEERVTPVTPTPSAQTQAEGPGWTVFRGGAKIENFSADQVKAERKNAIDNGFGIYVTSDTDTADYYAKKSEGVNSELRILAPRDSLLDRNATLASQSPFVISALQQAGLFQGNETLTGAQLYNKLVQQNKKTKGIELSRKAQADDQRVASKILEDAGIRGMSYLADHIGGKGRKEHYVIFNGADIQNAPETAETRVTPVTPPVGKAREPAPGNQPRTGDAFDAAGWTEQENKINKKTGQPSLSEGRVRYKRTDEQGFDQTVIVQDGVVKLSSAVSPVIELTDSSLDFDAPVRGRVHVSNSDVQGLTLLFVPDDSSNAVTAKMSPRAVQQYQDGVPIEKIAETEFSDAGGIMPDGSRTPHTTVGKLVSAPKERVTPVTPAKRVTPVTPAKKEAKAVELPQAIQNLDEPIRSEFEKIVELARLYDFKPGGKEPNWDMAVRSYETVLASQGEEGVQKLFETTANRIRDEGGRAIMDKVNQAYADKFGGTFPTAPVLKNAVKTGAFDISDQPWAPGYYDMAGIDPSKITPAQAPTDAVAEHVARFNAGQYRISTSTNIKGQTIKKSEEAYIPAVRQFLEGPLTAKPPTGKQDGLEITAVRELNDVSPQPIELKGKPGTAKGYLGHVKALHSLTPKYDVRYYLKGVLLDPKTDRIAATDGHRIAIINKAGSKGNEPARPEKGVAATDDIIMGPDGQWAMDGTNPISGKFPNIDKVIPKAEDQTAPETFNTDEFLGRARAVEKANKYFKTKYPLSLAVQAGNRMFAFNPQYLGDMAELFRKMGYETFNLSLPKGKGPLLATSPDGKVQQVVMPMRDGDDDGKVVPMFWKPLTSGAKAAEKPAEKTAKTAEVLEEIESAKANAAGNAEWLAALDRLASDLTKKQLTPKQARDGIKRIAIRFEEAPEEVKKKPAPTAEKKVPEEPIEEEVKPIETKDPNVIGVLPNGETKVYKQQGGFQAGDKVTWQPANKKTPSEGTIDRIQDAVGVKGFSALVTDNKGKQSFVDIKSLQKSSEDVVNNEEPSPDLPADRRLVLMPCCDMKGPEKAPAMELYKGVFFQTFRANAQTGATPKVVILSAKHGFVLPTEEIAPYDELMTPERADEMVAKLAQQMRRVQWPENIDDVLIVGGKEYQRVMRAAVLELQKTGEIAKDASVNATSGGIGEQRKQLGQYLKALPAAEKPQEQPVVPFEADVDAVREALESAGGEDERYQATFKPDIAPRKPTATEFLTPAQAKDRLETWKQEARKQGETGANTNRTVISLFDASGEWAKPWEEAGFNVVTYDLQTGDDIMDFNAEMLVERHGNDEIWAILAAPPCTDFASSGAQFWAKKDADGRTQISNELVRQVLRTVELFRPPVWVMENPVGRIAKLNQLPPALLTFQPNLYGDPYTKKTLLWGNFNNELPEAPVQPTEGSKIHKISGKDKYARSLTPEGFAYSFFMANNPENMSQEERLARQFPGIAKEEFVGAGSEQTIRTAIEDDYYDNNLEGVREVLQELRATAAQKPEYTDEQRKKAEGLAKDIGGTVVWQRGDFALIRGFSVLTGDPVYAGANGGMRTRVDVEKFTGDAIPQDVLAEMVAAKKKIEEDAEKKHASDPFIKFVNGVAVSESISAEVEGITRQWKDVLKIDAPLYLATVSDARTHRDDYTGPHRRIGSSTLDANERGSVRRMADGSYYIVFADSTSPTLVLETIAHELGHIHQRLVFENASASDKKALEDAHRKWLEQQKGKPAQDLVNALRGRATQRRTKTPSGMSADDLSSYWKSFSEWYADQVSRWAVSGKVPVTIVEKFFKRLGNQLRRFYQVVTNAKYLPDETFVQYIEKVTKRPTEISPSNLDVAERMVQEPGTNDDEFEIGGSPQVKFDFDTGAADEIAKANPVVAQSLKKADELPKAKKKLPPGRSPELAAAAQQVLDGTMTAAKFDELVNLYKPIPVYAAPLEPATSEQVYNSLDVLKREKINPTISTGYPVGLRLDIPAFNRHGVFVVTIHEKRTPSSPGEAIGYTSVASIKNVKFGVGNQKEALRIAAGKAKDAIQTMEGDYVPITPEEAYRRAKEAFDTGEWVQIGIDPTRHAYFYDRRTTQPVTKADEVIQIGNMILARGVTYGSKSDYLFNIDSGPGEITFSRDRIRKEQIKDYARMRSKLARAMKEVAEGKVDIDVQRNISHTMQASRDLQAEIKASTPRRDSAERFMARALTEFDEGNISADVLAVIQSAYNTAPELLEGLLLSVKTGKTEGTSGSFNPIARIVALYKGTRGVADPTTIRHEMTHTLEQMMTPEQRMAIVQAWAKALQRAIKQNPDEMHQRYFNAVLDFIDNPSERTARLARRALPSYDMYQFINPSEFWAVNGERLMAAELGGAWDKFKRSVRKLYEGLKNVFGFDNRYAIHKTFDEVMSGSKKRMDRQSLVDFVRTSEGPPFTTLENIEEDQDLIKKYNRPNTPMLDNKPVLNFMTRQFKAGKEFFQDMVTEPGATVARKSNDVVDGLIDARIQNVWFGAGLESRDFDKFKGELSTSLGMATPSVALDNAIRSGNIGVEVIFRGGIQYDPKSNNFVAVEREKGMRGVYEAEGELKKKLGDQLGTNIIQGYLEAKRSISIMNELYDREADLENAKQNLEAMRASKRPAEEIAIAEAAVRDAKTDVDNINKAVSSVNMSEEEMQEFASLDERHPELRKLMENWTAINQNLLRLWRQVGLISEGRYETLSAIKDYVPWQRIMKDDLDLHDSDQSSVESTTRSMTNIGKEKLFKRGKPISVVDFRAEEGQKDFKIQPSSVVKVKVNGTPVDNELISVTPNGEVRIDMDLKADDLVVFETNREIQNIIDNMTNNVMRMTMNGLRQHAANRIVAEYASRNENKKIMVFPTVDREKGRFNWIVNGKKVVVEIQDPLVAASVFGMEPVNFNKALGMAFKLSALAANVTRRSITLSGVFQLKQVFKDAPTAALVTGVKNPLALIGGVWKGLVTSLLQPVGKKVGVDVEPVVDILKAAGIGGYMGPARTPEAELKRRMGIMNRNVFSVVIKALDHIGDASDMAQRVATYKRVLKETGSETQALYQAANVINFLHHGAAGYAQASVKLVPFLGAYANATDVFVRALAGSGLKGVSRQRAMARLAVTASLLTTTTLLYLMLAGADPEYDELDDQTKLRNYIIPGTKIMLPMNTSAGLLFKAIPELIYNKITRDGTDNEYDARRLRRALGEAARDMLLGPEPVPAGFKQVLEVSLNHNFFTGRPVIPENLKDVEAAEQYTAATSELGKKISELLAIPGTEDKRVLSPIEADHMVRGLFGTAGAMAQWASNSIAVAQGERPEPTERETPITGSFLRDEVPRGNEDLYYDFKQIIDQKFDTWKKKVDREDMEGADAYFSKYGDIIGMKEYINEVDTELKEVNAEIKRLGESRDSGMTPQERRQEIDELRRLRMEMFESVKELRREVLN